MRFSPLTWASTPEHLAPVAFSRSCRPEERGNPLQTPPRRRKLRDGRPNSRSISRWSRWCCAAALPSCSLSSGKGVGFSSGFCPQPRRRLSPATAARSFCCSVAADRSRSYTPTAARTEGEHSNTYVHAPPTTMKQTSPTHSGWRRRGSAPSACPRFAAAPRFSWRAP